MHYRSRPMFTKAAARLRPGVVRALPRRLRRATLLIVGCGDVGLRIADLLRRRHPADRLRIVGTARSEATAAGLRARGIAPVRVDLDQRASLRRLRALAHWMIDLAPPPATGTTDPRSARLIAATTPSVSPTGAPQRAVYISTTGVYGDCGGAAFDETRPAAPGTTRARRRVDAELRFRRAGRHGTRRTALLRVPGIYDSGPRLPIERLRQRLPALTPDDDVHTNHIHADDLARICWRAVFLGRPGRVIHAVDDTDLKMGDYFDQVADALGLERPPRLPRSALAARVSPMMLSFMSESRRLGNARLKRELGIRLRYPDVAAALAEAVKELV